MPPEIPAGCPGHRAGRSTLINKTVRHIGTLTQRIVDNLLRPDEFAATPAFVGGDDDTAVGIDDAIAEGVGGETGKDDGMDCANAGACQQCDDRLGDHR